MKRIINNDIARFWSKVDKNGPVPTHRPELGPCWLWLGSLARAGYAQFSSYAGAMAHQFSYVLHKGHVPNGLEIDHLCRNRFCSNPEHLEAVTHQVNVLRGISPPAYHAQATHCPAGHEYSESDRNVRGERQCRICIRARAVESGGRSRGVMRSGPRKLTDADVVEMHRMTRNGVKYADIAEHFEMSYSSVEKTIRGFRWPEIYALFHHSPAPQPELAQLTLEPMTA